MVAAVPAGAVGKGLQCGGSSVTVTLEHGRQETPGTPQGTPCVRCRGEGEHWPLWPHGGHSGASLATKSLVAPGLGSLRSIPWLWVSSPQGGVLTGGGDGLRGRDPFFCSSNKICLVKRCVVCSWHGHLPSPPAPSQAQLCFPHLASHPTLPCCTPCPLHQAPSLHEPLPCMYSHTIPATSHGCFSVAEMRLSLSFSLSPLLGQLALSASPWPSWFPCRTWWSGRGRWRSLSAWWPARQTWT